MSNLVEIILFCMAAYAAWLVLKGIIMFIHWRRHHSRIVKEARAMMERLTVEIGKDGALEVTRKFLMKEPLTFLEFWNA